MARLPFLARLLLAALMAATYTHGARAGEIPDRPEKLSFPPLEYVAPKPADHRVVLTSGPVAYVAPDRELPLVTLSIRVRTGPYLDPPGKEGLADMTSGLLVRGGAGNLTAEALDERSAFLAAQLESSATESQGIVQLNLLSKDLADGLALLRDVLTAPRFQEDRLRLRRQQVLQAMKRRNDEADDIHQRELRRLAYGDPFFRNRHPTAASIQAIERSDLETFHRRWFVPSNFVVAASGDFDRDTLLRHLETLFANWPFKGETPPPVPTAISFAQPGLYVVQKDVNQGRVAVLLPGLQRDDPDFMAATVMNDILGGGGFTSRIMNRVRSDEGLAYSAASMLTAGPYYTIPFVAMFESKSATVGFATSIILEEMRRIANELVSEEELNTAKRALIETFPRQFATKRQVAATFADDEFTGRYARHPDYWDTYRARVAAVSRADVQRTAKRLLDLSKSVILVVGEKDRILAGDPNRPADLRQLAGGRMTELPLRDPMTMQPLPLSPQSAQQPAGSN